MLLLLGTAVRLIYGFLARDWQAAPDQMAWDLLLKELVEGGGVRYDQLIHYPHEGGGVLISGLALLSWPFSGFLPPLTLAALLMDLISRGIQVFLARKLFGDTTAWWFGIWTVFALPSLLPWATVNFGLHALSSFWPFVFLWALQSRWRNFSPAQLAGAVTGLALSMSYDSLILVPAFVVFLILSHEKLMAKGQQALSYLLTLILFLVPHLFSRWFFEDGFELKEDPWFSIRGEEVSGGNWKTKLTNVHDTLRYTLPGSSMLPQIAGLGLTLGRNIWLAFGFLGILMGVLMKYWLRRIFLIGVAVVGLYLLLFAWSPFFAGHSNQTNYVYYRHLTYILPLLTLLAIHGLVKARWFFRYLPPIWITWCLVGSLVFILRAQPPEKPVDRVTGWVLAKKLGHDPERLVHLTHLVEEEAREEMVKGFGWGATAALMEGVESLDHPSVEKLLFIYGQLPQENKEDFKEGILMAFEPYFTPTLEIELRPGMKELLEAADKEP